MKTITIQKTEQGYGRFRGGDPRKFHPDSDSSEAEVAAHRKACAIFDEAEAKGIEPTPEACPSGWVYDAGGKPTMHVFCCPYGLGIYEYDVEYIIGVVGSVGNWLRNKRKVEAIERNLKRAAARANFKKHTKKRGKHKGQQHCRKWFRLWHKWAQKAHRSDPTLWI